MAKVLTTASTVTCAHNFTVGTESTAKLSVDGSAVLLAASVSGKTVACQAPDSSTSKRCTSVSAITTGPAAKLKAGGQPVILDTLAGTTDGTPPALGTAVPNQKKLQAS